MQSQKMLGAAGMSHRVSYLYHPSYHGVLKMYSPTFRFLGVCIRQCTTPGWHRIRARPGDSRPNKQPRKRGRY